MTDAQLILIERADGADWSVKVADRTPPIWSVWLGIRAIITTILSLSLSVGADEPPSYHQQWQWYLGDPHRSQYSSLSQINVDNVAQLERVWIYHSGGEAQIQCNPIIVEGLLYGVSANGHVFALRADTGKQVWVFKPPHMKGPGAVVRGVLYWASASDKRVFAVLGHHLYAIDSRTGKLVERFGQDGGVNLKAAYDRNVTKLHIRSTSPGVIYKNILIVSVRVSEAHPAAPGDILAFNVITGHREWVFHTIPHPGEFGYDTWPPEAWKTAGGANCWAGMSLDHDRGIVYIPTGAATSDFYGADRKGDNLFANCLLALDAATGKRIWHFQAVHHDLWDRDLPAPPNLITVTQDGKRRDAVAQITKSGHVFLLDRDTGAPLFPVEERPVDASDVPGEHAAPTQPVPIKPPPFARQAFTEDLVTDRTPEAHAFVLERLRRVRTGRQFIPPSLQGTVIFPGFDGGGEWGGAATDPESGILYVNASEMPWILTLFEVTGVDGPHALGRRIYAQNCVSCHGLDLKGNRLQEFPPLIDLRKKYQPQQMAEIIRRGRKRMPSFLHLKPAEVEAVVRYTFEIEESNTNDRQTSQFHPTHVTEESDQRGFAHTGYNRFLDPDGYPAVKPPWGTLSAIDLNKGEIAWQVTLGESPELTAFGYGETGTENYGGPIVTAGGLIFIAATKDESIRAFNKHTGQELWRASLPAAGYATPCTYQIDGRQYVIIAAAGGKIGSPAGDAYVAFALPEDD